MVAVTTDFLPAIIGSGPLENVVPCPIEVLCALGTKAKRQMAGFRLDQADADGQGVVKPFDLAGCKSSDVGCQAVLVDSAKLLRENDRRGFQTGLLADFIMGGEFGLCAVLTCHSGDNDRGAVLIADVILDDDHRAVAVLFGADALTQVSIVQLPTFDCSVDGNDLLCVIRQHGCLCKDRAADLGQGFVLRLALPTVGKCTVPFVLNDPNRVGVHQAAGSVPAPRAFCPRQVLCTAALIA